MRNVGAMTQTTRSGLRLWLPPGLDAVPWLRAVVTTRHGGSSAPPFDSLNLGFATGDDAESVTSNRARLLEDLGLQSENVVKLSQVHGTRVWRVPDATAHEGDGLWTNEPGIALAVGVADCVPVFVWDVRSSRIALVHAGWRGTAAGIVGQAIGALCAAGSRTADLRLALGPCIGPCCYTVGADVASRFPRTAVAQRDGAIALDLRHANRLQGEACGLSPDQLHTDPPCTGCNTETFYSHRRLGPRTGRMWALAWIASAARA
jgi:purine-nucleoside/S-methyl-5'-thioadenosine phosphorylase / adenosine deaminase